MVFMDLFNLSDTEYACRIQKYPESQLLEQLKAKNLHITVVRGVGMGSGFLASFISTDFAPAVEGAMNLVGRRRVSVSSKKIQLIEAELKRRRHSASKIEDAAKGPQVFAKVEISDGKVTAIETTPAEKPGKVEVERLEAKRTLPVSKLWMIAVLIVLMLLWHWL